MTVAAPEATEPRVVLVTGGTRGIGKCIADTFRAQGDRVIITYRSGEAPEGVDAVQCDVSSTESVDAAFQEIESIWGPVEVLVANAGITKDTLVMRMTEDDFTSVLDTNLVGAFRVAKRATKGFLKLKRGRIIFISSVVAVTGAPGQANYAASKGGLTGMARAIVRELAARNVTANVIAPGYITTDMTAELPDDVTTVYKANIPAGRFGEPEEIANAVQWLASPGASYVNGTVIRVDGGLAMGL